MATTTTKTRRPTSGGIPRSPRLSRSGSTTSISPQESVNRSSSVSLPEIRALGPTSPQSSVTRGSRSATVSPRPSVHRSRSTVKSRSSSTTKEVDKEEESYKTIPISKALGSPQRRRLSLEKTNTNNIGDQNYMGSPSSNVAKLLRSSSYNMVVNRASAGKSLPRSPSSWGLSPRRASPGPPLAPESPNKVKSVSGVLKYFNKQKKVSPAQEEDFHQYRVMHNRLIQWRFVNAKAEVASAKVKRKAEEKLFGVWLKLYKMRYAIAEKKMKVERLRQKIKLLEIVCPQLDLLSEWEKLEKKNIEAVGRVTRKLSAYATKLPLVNGATGDIVAVFDAMNLAVEVMENIEDTIMKFHFQAEKVCNLLRELIHTVEENKGCFQELDKEIATVMSLEAREKSMIAHHIQANKEPTEEGQMNCKHHLIRSFINSDTRLAFSMLNVS